MLPSMQFTNPSGLMICPQSCATVNLRAQILLVLTSLKQGPIRGLKELALRRNFAMRNPAGKTAVGPLVVAAIVAFFSTQADAQEKLWKHGLINAKSDAGIFLMVSTRDFAKKQGLKIEISQFKDDQLALK